MKNKITKLSLALLLMLGTTKGMAQEMPKEVREGTNIEFLAQFAKEKEVEAEQNYQKAVKIAEERGLPLSGDKEERFFSLVGYDDETGSLIYKTTYNNVASASSLQTANAKVMHTAGVTGNGIRVGVWDGGVGLPNHQAFVGGRYTIRDGGNESWTTVIGRRHAAHVAGTVAAGNFGDGTAMGFAYESQVYAYNWRNDVSEMSAAAGHASMPILVSNHSYGIDYDLYTGGPGIFGRYDTNAHDFDVIANNAQYYTIVTAAGNDRAKNYNPGRGGKDLLSWGAVAKNAVTVAAVNGINNYTGPNSVTMSTFSNWGPTDDFRIKPDISAKGVNVKSISNAGTSSTETMSGTSMASPAVAGVFALWQHYHSNMFDNRYMKSATVRALMAHTAREAGPAPGPDFMFGWGLIDAGAGMEVMDQAVEGKALLKEFNLPNSREFGYEFSYDGVEPLVVTIAWNDPAYQATTWTNVDTKLLINDLDLRLINLDTQTTYYPWALRRSWSVAPTSTQIAIRTGDNMRDNIEKIEPENAVAGNYKIVVSHKGNLVGGSQDYSLIITGAGGIMPTTDGQVSAEKIALQNLSLYPNPVEDVLNLTGDLNVLDGSKMSIYDLSGKKVIETTFDANSDQLNVSKLESGVYILTISKEGVKQDYKFIKK